MVARKLEMRDSYQIRYRFESFRPGAPEGSRRWAYTAAIWRSADKLRVDVYDRESDRVGADATQRGRHVTCQNCERQNYTLVTTILPAPPGRTHLVEFRNSSGQPTDYFVTDIDWRFLGLCNGPLSTYNRVPFAQSYRERMANPLLKTSEQDRGGEACLVTEIEREKGCSAIWFGSKSRCNPVWFESHNGTGDKAVQLMTEVRWLEGAGKHLYPERVKHVARHAGVLQYEETITLQHADFDTPVAPSVFTLAGLGLNEGQPIAYPNTDPADWPVWRDGRADPSLSRRTLAEEQAAQARPIDAAPQPSPPVAAYPTPHNTSLVVGVVAGVIAAVSIVSALIYRRWRA
ncbi:hypothetical protein GobsT_60680 [Gemmata obscuriglobus]|nr:hypothetical protein GobsT_60680 [Gemmata obscuriglobus]VTS10585.1 unnamed protein product [Gemmata obscuriglobus UQM 2246]